MDFKSCQTNSRSQGNTTASSYHSDHQLRSPLVSITDKLINLVYCSWSFVSEISSPFVHSGVAPIR